MKKEVVRVDQAVVDRAAFDIGQALRDAGRFTRLPRTGAKPKAANLSASAPEQFPILTTVLARSTVGTAISLESA